MKSSTLKFLLLVSVVLNLATLATVGYRAYQRTAYWTSPFGHRLPRDRFLFEELGLAAKQVEAMKGRAIPFRAELDRQRTAITSQRKGLIGLLRQEPADLAAIKALIARISDLQETMQQQVATHMLEERALMDREQQHRFFDLIEKTMDQGSHSGCPITE